MSIAAQPLPASLKYDRTSVVLHWLIALLLLGDGVLALLIDTWPREQRPPVVNIHAIIGVTVLLLTFWRIANRFANPAPPLPPARVMTEKLAKAGHGLLYLGTIAIPLTGAITLWLRGRGLDFGVFQVPPLLAENKDAARSVKEIHELMFYGTLAVVAGHVAAALWHQFSLKDRLLERMRF